MKIRRDNIIYQVRKLESENYLANIKKNRRENFLPKMKIRTGKIMYQTWKLRDKIKEEGEN